MEFNEFDRLIKEKVEGGKLLHEKEAERSKLYVWRRIQESFGSHSNRHSAYCCSMKDGHLDILSVFFG